MKRKFLLIISILFILGTQYKLKGQDNDSIKSDYSKIDSSFVIDFTKPENVLKALIWGAKNREFNIFRYTVDPIDNKGFIASATKESQVYLENLLFQFENMRINGNPIYLSEIECKTPIIQKIDGRETHDFMKLIKRYGNWYIYKL